MVLLALVSGGTHGAEKSTHPGHILAGVNQAEDYRNLIYEGMRLKENCRKRIEEKSPHQAYWQRQRAKLSVYSTLQYVGLETVMKFLSLYARHFKFTEDEYGRLGRGLMGNYCSSNMTIMTHETLMKKWIASFHHPPDRLPYHEGRPLFKHFSPLFVDQEKIRKREFALTVELFKSFCSWGNDPDDLRLLVPLIRNPAVSAFVFRHMTHTRTQWHERAKELLYRNVPEASSISCKNLLCRRDRYKRFAPEELRRLYCRHLRDVDYKKNPGVPPKIKKIIDARSENQSQLMTSHFISLLTRTSNPLLYGEKFSDIRTFLRMPMEQRWKKWLLGDRQYIDPKFLHEERLSLDPIPYPRPHVPFGLAFQVNFGEWDKAVTALGRVKKVLRLNVFANVLARAQRTDTENPEQTLPYLAKMLGHQIARLHPQTSLPLSVEEWRVRVATELAGVIRRRGRSLPFGQSSQKISIPIEIYYAPFALQYLHRRGQIEELKKQSKPN